MKDFKRFASEAFKKEYHCDKPLGAFCGQEGTRIYLWAPTAEAVFLHIYPKGNHGLSISTKETWWGAEHLADPHVAKWFDDSLDFLKIF